MDWIVLALLMAALLYTAIVIKREKLGYFQYGRRKRFYDYTFLVPSWWKLVEESRGLMRFERGDERYDWVARFERKPCLPSSDAKELVQGECERLGIDFDEDRLERIEDARFIQCPQGKKTLGPCSLRLVGTAGQFGTKRCHLDLLVIKRAGRAHYDLFYSWSSVLHALVEGPYFDEVLKNLTLSESKKEGTRIEPKRNSAPWTARR
ncbi:MAG: hypothetical protein OXB88_10880 [Bacteriovoracales bacterium]|nr:hypothetical protein [Bacteriovoracales bacterium]